MPASIARATAEGPRSRWASVTVQRNLFDTNTRHEMVTFFDANYPNARVFGMVWGGQANATCISAVIVTPAVVFK